LEFGMSGGVLNSRPEVNQRPIKIWGESVLSDC
jgi:hypothetical protein